LQAIDLAAGKIGEVAFKLQTDGPKLNFIAPAGWRTEVVAKPLDPPQDPPTVILQWVSLEGRAFTGEIGWQDDASEGPTTFGIRLDTSENETRWATWSCHRLYLGDRVPPISGAG
jgi:hypothetical protein